jgi:hypothetical protein
LSSFSNRFWSVLCLYFFALGLLLLSVLTISSFNLRIVVTVCTLTCNAVRKDRQERGTPPSHRHGFNTAVILSAGWSQATALENHPHNPMSGCIRRPKQKGERKICCASATEIYAISNPIYSISNPVGYRLAAVGLP